MNDPAASEHFITEAKAFIEELSEPELYAFASTCTKRLEDVLQKGFANVNEGFNPDEGTKPINLIREALFPLFEEKLPSSYSTDDIPLKEQKIVFDFFKSGHPVDVAIKTMQDRLKLIANDVSMMAYVAFTNAFDKTIHGGLTAKDPMFVKAENPADILYVIFAGMVCFPEFKKSIAGFGNVDQLHILDPNRSWYMQGPEGEWNGYEHYTRVLREEIGKLKAETPYRKICFLGNSMGASAACLYSEHADAVLAFCPQTEIPRKETPQDVLDTYQKLLSDNLAASQAAGKDIRIHRGVSESDILQCSRLPEGITPIVHEGCDVHNLPGYLKSEGTLLDTLHSVI